MTAAQVTVAGLTLLETRAADQDQDTITIVGRESLTRQPAAAVRAAHDNIPQLVDRTVPVLWGRKSQLDGLYRVTAASSQLTDIADGAVLAADWKMTLERIGSSRDVEVESRVPTIARSTTVTTPPSAVFWHAPPVGTTSYWTGATVPTQISRDSADGAVPVFLGIPVGVAPRWTAAAVDYLKGSTRILFDGLMRVGEMTPPSAVWEVNNGLVRLQPGSAGAVTVSCWAAGAWRSLKSYQVTVNGTAVTTTPELTVLRNSPEEVAVRLSYPTTPGRVTVDMSLRRGARFITGVVKRHSAATLGLIRTAAEAATVVTGGLRATSADSDSNRFVMGSAAAVTTATGTAATSKAAVLTFDFFLGYEVGSSPQAGDAFADLWAQYRGSSGELARIVVR